MHLSVIRKKCENIAFYKNCKAHGVVTPHHQQVVVFLSILATLLGFLWYAHFCQCASVQNSYCVAHALIGRDGGGDLGWPGVLAPHGAGQPAN